MTSSLFYSLNSVLLLEYQLYDTQDSVEYTAASNGWIRIKDINEKKYQILNNDLSTVTNSNRDKSVVKLTNNTWAWLDTTPSINYLDTTNRFNYTSLDASNLDVNFSDAYNSDLDFVAHPKIIKYDKVRIHILLGYDFNDVDGYIFEVKAPYSDLTELTTAAVLFQKTDTWFTLNPRPFMQNGKIYGSYIEFLVPSIRNVVNDWKYANFNVLNYINPIDGINNKLLKDVTPGTFAVHSITKTVITPILSDNYSFFTTSLDRTISIAQDDNYSLLGCVIRDSTEGDYFEYFATYDGALVEDYMLFLINAGGSWMIQHDLVISELVGHDWIVSEKKTQIQLDSFDDTFTHRPVLKNSASASAYAIDYTIKLINADKGTAVYKKSSLTNTDVKKYGRKLLTIDLSRNPANLNKVYQRKDAPINMVNTTGTNSTQVVTQTLPTFYEKFNIQLGSEVLHLDTNGNFVTNSTDNSTKVWAQEELKIEIDPFDNWFLFRIYQRLQGTYVLMDLSGAAEYVLIINESLKFFTVSNKIANKTKGELLFKIDKNSAAFIIKSIQGKFYINSEINGQSTTIYKGFFSKTQDDYATKQLEIAATRSVSNTGTITETTSTDTTSTTSAVNLSGTTNPDLTVSKETNTVEIPGVSKDDGSSLKNINPVA